jgi:hypothetical protein
MFIFLFIILIPLHQIALTHAREVTNLLSVRVSLKVTEKSAKLRVKITKIMIFDAKLSFALASASC